jgi:2-polyprenyl-6-methoxyphenol hydroxylase-like FAD-dependent oxidoreductase
MEAKVDQVTLSTEVVIVGAGPAGLALGIVLAQAGVPFVVLDKLAQGHNTSRAAVIHAHTLDVLEGLGVTERLQALGRKLSRFSIRDRDRALVDLRFDALPSRHPHLLMIPQNLTEAVLNARLCELGGSVLRGWAVDAVADLGDGVQVSATSTTGEARAFRARYVVGADGMHSIVRKAAGIGFTGHTYEESFLLADVAMDWTHGNDEVKLFFSPAGMVVVAPLPDGTFRIVSTVDNAPERPTVADIQALLDARDPTTGTTTVTKVVWGSRFRLHDRVADTYRRGRLLLVGDAAHVHSPAGGQGMNTGLVDAKVLGEMLAAVIHGRHDDAWLDGYEAMRRPAALEVVSFAGRLTWLATMRNPVKRVVRNAVLLLLNRMPVAKRKLEMALSGLSRRAASRVPGEDITAPGGPRAALRHIGA